MASRSPQPSDGAGFFTAPAGISHRRYEALRTHYVDGLTWEQAGARFGYTRWAMVAINRDFRAGRLPLFVPPGKPGPKAAPRKDAARGRVIELRRRGLPVYEISAALAAGGISPHRSSAGQILAGEGFGRLIRGPAPEAGTSPATPGRDTRLPRAGRLDSGALPGTCDTRMAGLLLVIPDLVALGLPSLIRAAGYPGTSRIKPVNWILSLLALKLTATRRVSHADDLIPGAGSALFAGLAAIPEKTALTDYSCRLSRDHQQRFPAALDTTMTGAGLATAEEAISDLDFHAVMHGGNDPAPEKHHVPTRSQRACPVLTFFAQDTGNCNLVYASADISRATQAREVIAFCDHWKNASGADPRLLILDQRVTTQPVLGELDDRGVRFLTLRMRSAALMKRISALTPADCKTVPIDRPGRHARPEVAGQAAVKLSSYPGTVRQLIVTGPGRDAPAVIISNDHDLTTKALIGHYARRMTIEQRLAEIIQAFHAGALSSAVNLNADLDIMLCVLAQALLAAFRARPGAGYATVTPGTLQRRFPDTPGTLQRRFPDTPGQIHISPGTITVRIDRRACSPVLRSAGLPSDTPVPWRGGRRLHFQYQ